MLSERINELRKEKGISQKKLGELLGFSQQAVAKWENGSAEPDNETLLKLSNIFNVDINLLLGIELKELNKKDFISNRQTQLLAKYSSLDEKGKEVIDFILENEYSRQHPDEKPDNLSKDIDIKEIKKSPLKFQEINKEEDVFIKAADGLNKDTNRDDLEDDFKLLD